MDVPNQCNLPVTGFKVSYISHFSDPVAFDVGLERCFGGECSHTFDYEFDEPTYTLSVSSNSVLGAGPPTLLDFISELCVGLQNLMLETHVCPLVRRYSTQQTTHKTGLDEYALKMILPSILGPLQFGRHSYSKLILQSQLQLEGI